MGNDGYLLNNEIFLYVFDATLMFLAMAILNIVHPAEFVQGKLEFDGNGSVPLVEISRRHHRQIKSDATVESNRA